MSARRDGVIASTFASLSVNSAKQSPSAAETLAPHASAGVASARKPRLAMTSYHLPLANYLDLFIALALFAASLALYVRTLAPGLLDGDEGEFQTNIYKLGVSHTGYPLFFLSAKLFTLLMPLGTIATRANLFSAFFGAVTIAALYLFLRWLTQNRAAALVCAMLFAVSRVEWSQAVIPRVYTLNALFVVVVTALFFLWRAGKVDLTVPVFAYGLSLTNHRTMLWLAPAIAVFVLWHERAAPSTSLRTGLFQPRRLLTLAFAFLAPLVLYLYVPLRGDSDVGVEFHLKDFNEMILGGNVSRWMRYGPLYWIIGRVTNLYLPLLIEQFTPIGFVAGLIGMGALALNRAPRGWNATLPAREVFWFVLLANLGNSAFCVFFDTIDVEKFFIPSYLTFLLFVGVGVTVIGNWLVVIVASVIASVAKQSPSYKSEIASLQSFDSTALRSGSLLAMTSADAGRLRAVVAAISIAPFLAVAAYLLTQNYARNDWSARTDVANAWNENLALPLEKSALIVGPWETLTPLEYAQSVDGTRRDIEHWKVIVKQEQVKLTLYGSRQEDIEREVRAGRAVYLTVHPGETETLTPLADEFRLTRVAELWRLIDLPPRDRPQTADYRLQTAFVDREGRALELLGYSIHPQVTLRAGDFVLVTLYWRAPESLGARYTVSLRLVDATNRVIAQRDSEPASGARPTIGWASDEIVQDDAGIFVPRDAAAGAYQIAVVVYNSRTIEDLVTGTAVQFGEIRVEP